MNRKIWFIMIIVLFLSVISILACGKKDSNDTDIYQQTVVADEQPLNMEEFLVEYDEFVDEYIAMLQNLQAGDSTAFEQFELYQSLYENWINRLQGITDDDLTPEIIKRLEDISRKVEDTLLN